MMWTKRLRPRTDDAKIPRKKYKVAEPLNNCSQKQNKNINRSASTKKTTNQQIEPQRAVSVPNITVQQSEEIDQNSKEFIIIPTNASYTSPEGRQITPQSLSSLVNKIAPTILEKLLVNPERNNEIKISGTGDQNEDFDVIVELVDHTEDCMFFEEMQANQANGASDKQSTVLNDEVISKITDGLPDAETPQGTDKDVEPKRRSSSRLSLKRKAAQDGIMLSKKSDPATSQARSDPATSQARSDPATSQARSDPATSQPKSDVSIDGCEKKTTPYILTRSRSSKAAVLTDVVGGSGSNPAPQVDMKQSSGTKRRVVKKIDTPANENCSGKREVFPLPKFRPWPRASQGPRMGAFRSHKELTLMDSGFCKMKSIFLDTSLKQIDKKWRVRLVEKGHHYGVEWNMYQLSTKTQMTILQEAAVNDIARKLHCKQKAGAKILSLSEAIYHNLANVGLQQSVVEVIVHHSQDETTPATAWILRQQQNPLMSICKSDYDDSDLSLGEYEE